MSNLDTIVKYKITDSQDEINALFGITPTIAELMSEVGIKVQKKKNSAIKELNDLMKKHPHVPQFKNYLSTLYEAQGNHFMAQEVTRRCLVLHPNYLFGRLNVANIAIHNKEFEKVPALLGENMELQSLYPERTEFHIGEVASFYQTAIYYFVGIKNQEQAQVRLDILVKLDNEFDLSINISSLRLKISLLSIESSLDRLQNQTLNRRVPTVIGKKVVDETTIAPVFTHEIINELYCNILDIDHRVIVDILALPRETLLSDLHKVVYDSIARIEVFADMDWDQNTHEFLMHALFILAELKDESSVKVILDLLQQDDEYFEFWFGDFLTGDMWEIIYHIAKDKLELLFDFMIEPNVYTYSKSSVLTMVEQLMLHQPERRPEVTEWYKRILQFWIDNHESEDLIDSDVIGFMVSDIVNYGLTKLIPQLHFLFENNMVSVGICGSLEVCLADIESETSTHHSYKIFPNVFERYNARVFANEYFEDNDHNDDKQDTEFEKQNGLFGTSAPTINNQQKVGRNEPCPCGSGKKFKKCCG